MAAFIRSPRAPPYSAVPSVQSPAGKHLQQTGSLGTSVQRTTVPSPSPRILHQPGTPDSLPESPYNGHNPATPSPASRILHQPGTPDSLPESPYNGHNPATPSPASRQQSTPSPMRSPAPAQINPLQQHQQAHDAKFLNR